MLVVGHALHCRGARVAAGAADAALVEAALRLSRLVATLADAFAWISRQIG